jgi:hypothetical protein
MSLRLHYRPSIDDNCTENLASRTRLGLLLHDGANGIVSRISHTSSVTIGNNNTLHILRLLLFRVLLNEQLSSCCAP